MSGASATDRRAERDDNFKTAVLRSKGAVEKEVASRNAREEALHDASDADRKQATLLENMALQAKRKPWSTADFESVKVIGEGAFGVVHLVRGTGSEKLYALKQMKKTGYRRKNYRDRAFAERDILAEATSRWFVQLCTTFQDELNVYMVMEFLQGGDLIGHLLSRRRFTNEQARFYMAELLEALDTVHQCGFVHRDVKPDNVVLHSDGHIKLLDFGLCKQDPAFEDYPGGNEDGSTTRRQLKSAVGTPQYMAPEVFQSQSRPDSGYGKEADLWALGIMTFECLVGRVPFNSGTRSGPEAIQMIRDQVLAHARHLPRHIAVGRERGYVNVGAENFILGLLCSKDSRLDADGCRQAPFFQGIDFPNIHLQAPPIVPELAGACDTRHFEEFEARPLPVAGHAGCAKDRALEWSSYEFDSNASLLSRNADRARC